MNFHRSTWMALGLASMLQANAQTGGDPFAENIRSTPWLSPQEEEASFQVPEGFEIQLFASEPDINKPMNMAFDEMGRLWVTSTVEYPYPVSPDQRGRDAIKILEDTDGNGRADKVTTFVDDLNIPLGILPYQGGAIAFSIPNIWHFPDRDGDGKADERFKLYGPLGWERDTHGLNSSFVRGLDGWLYATHGYNNNTVLSGADGSEIRMNSGNTYRVRFDGSRVEQHTWGQVNPFGMCYDPFGNLYTADCHSAPIYQLIRGGYYPSFGKPHDGLGFAPTLMQHQHGSTAISGIVYYSGNDWPEEYRDNVFIGNVMTSRVNRDRIAFQGSSPTAREAEDFVKTTDPWFRPVNIQMGPDGAMYVADFYNRIIGHYEVPLNHPGRDRESGRIWRISYHGNNSTENQPPDKPTDFTVLPFDELIEELGNANMTRRMLAMNVFLDRHGEEAAPSLQSAFLDANGNAYRRAHLLWILFQLDSLADKILIAASLDDSELTRSHLTQLLGELPAWTPLQRELALGGITDASPFVRRRAAEALGRHPRRRDVDVLLEALRQTPMADDHLRHTIRIALKSMLKEDSIARRLPGAYWTAEESEALADVFLAVDSPNAARFMLSHLIGFETGNDKKQLYLQHAANHANAGQIAELERYIRKTYANDVDSQLTFFQSIANGLRRRGEDPIRAMRLWAEELATNGLKQWFDQNLAWNNQPLPVGARSDNPWHVQRRRSQDGRSAPFLSSLPGGESGTGLLQSNEFEIPGRLEFYLAGHDGFPDEPLQNNNYVQLVDAKTGQVLKEAEAPRNDLALRVVWDLEEFRGRRGRIEIQDADTAGAYAWLAAGRFDPPLVGVPNVSPAEQSLRQIALLDLIEQLGERTHADALADLLNRSSFGFAAQGKAAEVLADMTGRPIHRAAAPLTRDLRLQKNVRQEILKEIAAPESDPNELLKYLMAYLPFELQKILAGGLASLGASDALLTAVESGWAPAQLLLDSRVEQALSANPTKERKSRINQLTQNLDSLSNQLIELINQRIEGYKAPEASPMEGRIYYQNNCAVCHSIGGQGGLVGPQLDGIGNRGLTRIAEDVLDPNRNVDLAFRTTLIVINDEDVETGLFRREEGALLILADSTGKEIQIDKSRVTERRELDTSLMPENFGEILDQAAFNDLMAYLLEQR